MSSNNTQVKAYLFFDDECPLCLRFSQALKRIDSDGVIEFHSIREPTTFELFPQLDTLECQATVHLLTHDHKLLKGSEVIDHLIGILPAVSKFSWLLDNQIGKKTTQLFYGVLQSYRESLLNRCPKCKNRARDKCNH